LFKNIQRCEEDQSNLLLDMIEKGGMSAIVHLEEALKNDFDWKAKLLDETFGITDFKISEAAAAAKQLEDEKVFSLKSTNSCSL